VTRSDTDRALIALGFIGVVSLACARVYLRAQSATLSAEQSLTEGRHLEAVMHAQEASRSWLPFSPFRIRAEAVMGAVSAAARETHSPPLRAIADRALQSARIEGEWLYAQGPRRRVHGRPSWIGVGVVAVGVASLLAIGRMGRRWPVAVGVALVCCAFGYLLPV
jgi:hypothetical protein